MVLSVPSVEFKSGGDANGGALRPGGLGPRFDLALAAAEEASQQAQQQQGAFPGFFPQAVGSIKSLQAAGIASPHAQQQEQQEEEKQVSSISRHPPVTVVSERPPWPPMTAAAAGAWGMEARRLSFGGSDGMEGEQPSSQQPAMSPPGREVAAAEAAPAPSEDGLFLWRTRARPPDPSKAFAQARPGPGRDQGRLPKKPASIDNLG